ncbi:MAG TPA: hypothetical protein DCP90_08620 [Clostridiales bacterium]|nr:MAG: hypothetical protein A2Y22_05805 [Clostridiales bacterium GWD2_32_59]HAN10657.1 hypothetical protein [Clostridiales bacterium]
MQTLKKFYKDERGINTVEIVVILAIVVGLALIFRDQMFDFVTNLIGSVTGGEADLSSNNIRNTGNQKID